MAASSRTTGQTAVLDDLAATVDGQARAATGDDTVAGVQPRWVAAPASLEQASALLRAAARLGLTVVPRGRGTALAWGTPPRSADLVVSTERMATVVEHNPGDLVCVVDAGATLDAVNAHVGAHGQQLALDQPVPGASVGGTVSTTRSGPRRLMYGTPRDQVLGMTMVRADGTVATAGSKVVKNVAGYDVAKLLGGAYGTLGLIGRVVLRLHPRPRARMWLKAWYTDPWAAAGAARRVAGSQLAPSAVEIRRTVGASAADVLVLLEGTGPGVDGRSRQLLDLLSGATETTDIDTDEGDRLARLPVGADDTLVKVAVPLPGVEAVLRTVHAAESRYGLPCHLQGSAGAGVLYVVLPAGARADAVPRVVAELREAASGGSAVVLQAPPQVRALVDTWGPVNGLTLMRRIKDEFDPEHRFSPGRFVGGI
ncbi:MAG: FAD-binding oxidoreductase [Actinomycetota bacterium]|nr:FAD-binding oxidoreductase [Actinomycetota bacterium]